MNSSMGASLDRSAATAMSSPGLQAATLHNLHFPSEGACPNPYDPDRPPSVEEFGLRHLKTPAEIEQILYLRKAIDLSVHSRALAHFLSLEKKETSAALSAPSSCAERP